MLSRRLKEKEMKTEEAFKIIGGSLSKPSKMPGWSIGLPARECKTGAKLQKVPGSVCYDCYAMKGCYVFKVVQDAPDVTTVVVLGQEPEGSWSIIGMEKRIIKLDGALDTWSLIHASRVGIQ